MTDVNKDKMCKYSASTKHDFYRGPDCMEKFGNVWKMLEAINYEEKEMLPMPIGENGSHKRAKVCYICQEKFQFKK